MVIDRTKVSYLRSMAINSSRVMFLITVKSKTYKTMLFTIGNWYLPSQASIHHYTSDSYNDSRFKRYRYILASFMGPKYQ